jgi:DNA repair exonuclease SbcCD ATPase subunit
MSEKSDPNFITPLAIWRSFQEANLDAWSQGMAALVNTDAYAESMRNFLDTYVSTSAPFRKVLDQYMAIWLSNMNMPSRDEIARLEQRMITTEIRLNSLSGQLDQLFTMLQGQQTQTRTASNTYTAGIEQLESHTQELDTKTDQLIRLLEEQKATLTALVGEKPETAEATQDMVKRADLTIDMLQFLKQRFDTLIDQSQEKSGELVRQVSVLEQRAQEISQKLDQHAAVIAQPPQPTDEQKQHQQHSEERLNRLETNTTELTTLLQNYLDQTNQTASSQTNKITDLDQRVQGIEQSISQLHSLMQQHAQQPPAPPPAPNTDEDSTAEIAQIESRINALDDKTVQVLEALQTVQDKLQTMTPKPRTRKTTSTKKTTSKTTSAKEKAAADAKPDSPAET